MPTPDRGRWCEEHQRFECVSPRKSGRGACHQQHLVRGTDKCRMHLGRKAAPVIAEALARKAVETYGLPRDIDPVEALLEEVHYTAGHVAWLRSQIQALAPEALAWGITEQVEKSATEFPGTDTTYAATVNTWLEMYRWERKHLLDVTKAAISVGIEERRVKLAEAQGALLNEVMRRIFARLSLNAEQSELLRVVVPEELRRAAVSVTAGMN